MLTSTTLVQCAMFPKPSMGQHEVFKYCPTVNSKLDVLWLVLFSHLIFCVSTRSHNFILRTDSKRALAALTHRFGSLIW